MAVFTAGIILLLDSLPLTTRYQGNCYSGAQQSRMATKQLRLLLLLDWL